MLKKITAVLLSIIIITSAFSGCSTTETQQKGYSFTDSLNNTISLEKNPRKVAVLFSSLADLWQCAGGIVSVSVGESIERGFCKEGIILVDDTAGKTINSEILLSSGVDFVIGSSDIDAQNEACELSREAGIPAASIKVESFSDYLHWLEIFTDITGNKEAYKTNGTDKKQRIDSLLASVESLENREILFIRAGSKYSSTKAKNSDDNFASAMLKELGCINIADSVPVLLDGLSVEYIIEKNPSHIFIVTMGKEEAAKKYMKALFKEPQWQQLDAVKNNAYTFLPKNLFHYKPNSRWDEAYEYLVNILYPEIDTDAM